MIVERYLLFFPFYWAKACENADQALHGGYGRPFDVPGRGSGVSDPTARRGIAYAEAREELQQLVLVRQWIDGELSPGDRLLLINMWRYKKHGWYWVARHVGLGVFECRERWDKLSNQLDQWIAGSAKQQRKAYAGPVCG